MPKWSPQKPVTPEVKDICIQMKTKVEKMAGAMFAVYTPLDFISEDEGEINHLYIVKVDVDGDKYVHAKISQAGGGELDLEAIRYPKTRKDPLVPF